MNKRLRRRLLGVAWTPPVRHMLLCRRCRHTYRHKTGNRLPCRAHRDGVPWWLCPAHPGYGEHLT